MLTKVSRDHKVFPEWLASNNLKVMILTMTKTIGSYRFRIVSSCFREKITQNLGGRLLLPLYPISTFKKLCSHGISL